MKTSILLGITMLLLTIPAAASDFTLEIFGNANEDDTINMQDVTYTELIILEYRDRTELADGKHDDKINMQDVTQIELIILGRELELTITDEIGQIVTVHKPVEKIVAVYHSVGEAIRALGAKDRVVGVDDLYALKYSTNYPDLSKKPCVGKRMDLDVEAILELDPDTVILGKWHTKDLEDKLKGTGIDVVRVCPYEAETLRNKVMQLGYILDEEENAKNYFEWHDKYINEIQEAVSGISDDERTRVFIEDPGGTIAGRKITGHILTAEQAGGKLITADLPGEQQTVEVEWIIDQNPDVIVAAGPWGAGGYESDDESPFKAYYDEIRGLPGFDHVKAVQNDRVYIMHGHFGAGLKTVIGTTYMAKWFYPDLFEDLEPHEMHQEFIDEFCPGLDFDVSEHDVFVYPPLEES